MRTGGDGRVVVVVESDVPVPEITFSLRRSHHHLHLDVDVVVVACTGDKDAPHGVSEPPAPRTRDHVAAAVAG